MKIINKTFAIVLSVLMLFNSVAVMATPISEGENGETVYISFTFSSDKAGNTTIDSVESGSTFYVWANIFNNPTDIETTSQAYTLCIGFDSAKINMVKKSNQATLPTFNGTFATGVALATATFTDGILDDEEELTSSAPLFRIEATALSDLDEEDLNSIKLLPSATGKETQETKVIDGNKKRFTLIQLPEFEIGAVTGDIFTSSTADDVKNALESFSVIDKVFSAATYTKEDSEWDNLEITIPAGSLAEGVNTLTAKYGNFECEFDVKAKLDAVESIEITTEPDRTEYSAFETFDKTGMVVTATYESGKTADVTDECKVDEDTKLKVADTEWVITYGNLEATQEITVLPLSIKVPVESSEQLVYTGEEQEFGLSTYVEKEYVSITGSTSGKNAGTYNATASLKDTDNTEWDNGTTEDIELSWTIDKAEITSGINPMAKRYTTTYSQLPTEADVVGVNAESVSADITWYADENYEDLADDSAQIAESFTGEGQTVTLYYKANGMDNYESYKGSVVVSVTDKDLGTVSVDTLPAGLTKDGDVVSGTYSKDGFVFAPEMFDVKSKEGASLGKAQSVVIESEDGRVDEITSAGTYTVLVSYEDKDNKATYAFTVEIAPKSIEGTKVSLKFGDEDAVETTEDNPLSVVYAGEDITPVIAGCEDLAADDYYIDETDSVLSAKDVSDEVYVIAIKGQGNYTGTIYGYWQITPAKIYVYSASVLDKVYNGVLDDAVVTEIDFTGLKGTDTLVRDVDYEVKEAFYTSTNAGASAVNVSVALKNTVKNYALANYSIQIPTLITKAGAPTLSVPATQTLLSSAVVDGAKEYTFDMSDLIEGLPADAGQLAFAVATEGEYVKKTDSGFDGSVLMVNVAQPQAANVTDSVTIVVSSENYEDATFVVNFEFKNKTAVEVTLDDISTVYGDDYTVEAEYAALPDSGYTWTYTYVGVEDTDYPACDVKPVKPGKYSVTAHYEDNIPDSVNPEIPGHVGEATAIIEIAKKELAITDGDVTITKVYDAATAAGTLAGTLALEGAIGDDEVYVDMTLAAASDYSAADAGTYTVEITGFVLAGSDKDNYTIAESYNFANAEITKQVQSAVVINETNEDISKIYGDVISIVLGGGNGTGEYKLVCSEPEVLSLNADSNDSSIWNIEILKVGTATLTASRLGDNNYEASEEITINVVIETKDITEADFEIDLATKVFAGEEIEPSVTSETLVEGTDYDVTYENNVNVGTATITISGQGNYSSYITKTFDITQKELNDAEFTISGLNSTYTYTGLEIKPSVTVIWDDITLVKDTDYEVTYADNIEAGTATVTITGINNYFGSISKTYTISPAQYTGTVTVSANEEVVTIGTVLTVNPPAGSELSYQWKRNGVAIALATDATYTVTMDDIGKDISVAVTSAGNYAGTIESAALSVGKLALTGEVTISAADGIITATVTNAPAAENYDIVWLCDGSVISGKNGTTYSIVDSDKGKAISAKLVAKGDTYTGEIVSEAYNVPAEAPSFVKEIKANAGNRSITVKFEAKPNGAEITNYEIILNGEVVATVGGDEDTYTITNLENKTEYTVKVAAINSVGRTESESVTATPYKSSNGGGGSTSSRINVNFAEGGKITTNLNKAAAGKTVVVTVTADEGYELSKLVVTDKKGNEISVTADGDEYSFEMPETIVTIDAEFTKIKEDEKPDDPVEIKFDDVKETDYYYDSVKWAVEKGVTTGISEKIFSPEAECSRAQMVTFLWRAAGSPVVEGKNPFTDVKEDAYYYNAVMWAVKNGITLGISETQFAPDNKVSRAQSVTFLWRVANKPAAETESSFKDVAKDAYYSDAVSWAASVNVTNGMTESTFAPDDVCIRAQIVTFIYRYFVK